MKGEHINRIIRAYFGKHFSKQRKILFGRWLKGNDFREEKEDELYNIWNEDSPAINDSTYEDWYKVKQQLTALPATKKRSFLFSHPIRYTAAAIALVLTTTLTTYYLFVPPASPSNDIEMTELFVSHGESREITLPDNSKVWVNAGSILVYPKDFNQVKSRVVYLTGEASFSVTKNAAKPFIVKTAHVDVEALGTEFTVEAYPSDGFTSATLEKGSIQVDVKAGTVESSVLKPCEQLVYNHQEHTIDIHLIDLSLHKMERDGYLIFGSASFRQLMSALERRYNVVIHYDARKYSDNYYNVKFAPAEELEDVFEVLHELIGINYKIKDNVVIIN